VLVFLEGGAYYSLTPYIPGREVLTMKSLKAKAFFIIFLVLAASVFLAASVVMDSGNVQAYYGGFGGLGSPYFGLSSPYYGAESLYSGLYGLGGLYGGINSLYSSYGLYGDVAGLYGLAGLGVAGDAGLIRRAQVPAVTTPVIPVLPDPTGSWLGSWVSYVSLTSGTANFQLIYAQGTLVINGTAGVLLNKLVPVSITVTGTNGLTGFTLSGTYFDLKSFTSYSVSYTCSLSTPTFITGSYLIHDPLYLQVDTGTVGLSLANPVPTIAII